MAYRIPVGFTTVREQASLVKGTLNDRQRKRATRICVDRFKAKYGRSPSSHQTDRTKSDSWDFIFPSGCAESIRSVLTEVLDSVDNQPTLF